MAKSFNKFNNSNLPSISYKFYYLMISLIFMLSITALFINNFMHLWIIMEINTLILISLMALTSKSFKTTFNFFIIQSVSSLMLIILFIVMNNFSSSFMFNFILLITFFMKFGLFPFFFWPPMINSNINWLLIFIMSTSQKIIPLLMFNLYLNLNNNNNNQLFFHLTILSALISSIISTIMNYNETNFKKIITFSSTNHLSWMIFILLFDSSMFLTYFIIYSLSMIFMCFIFNKFNINSFNDLIKIKFFNGEINFIISLNFLIISALPPFLTFIIKMNTIKILIENNSMFPSLLLSMTSIFTLIFYMNIVIKMNMFSMIKTKFFSNQLNLKSNFMSVISISFLSLIFMFYLFNSIH